MCRNRAFACEGESHSRSQPEPDGRVRFKAQGRDGQLAAPALLAMLPPRRGEGTRAAAGGVVKDARVAFYPVAV